MNTDHSREASMSALNLLKPIAALISYYKFKSDRLRLAKRIEQGLKVGKNVYIMENVEFDVNYPYLIEIGDNCTIAKDVRVLAHDATTFRALGVTRLAPVKILEGTFIAERAIILPGVTLGPRAMIAAGSVVNRDIGEGKAAAGNPARPYGNYVDLLKKYADTASTSTVINKIDFESGRIGLDNIAKSIEKDGFVFVSGVPTQDPYYVNTDMNQMRKNALQAFHHLKKSSSTQDSPE